MRMPAGGLPRDDPIRNGATATNNGTVAPKATVASAVWSDAWVWCSPFVISQMEPFRWQPNVGSLHPSERRNQDDGSIPLRATIFSRTLLCASDNQRAGLRCDERLLPTPWGPEQLHWQECVGPWLANTGTPKIPCDPVIRALGAKTAEF